MKNRIAALLISLGVILVSIAPSPAQDTSGQQPPAEQQQNDKASQEAKAVDLLEQVISESQALKLPENRTRVQINAGDLLWERDQGRARTMFTNAAASIADMMRGVDSNDRQYFSQIQTPSQLRQELLLKVARRDATLAYQLLQATRPPSPPSDRRGGRRFDTEDNLEQMLLAQIAATDPKVAMQYAEALLDKGQYPGTVPVLLSRLQRQDQEAAAKFSTKLLSRLQADNLLTNRDASNLAFSLLLPGPRPAAPPAGDTKAAPQNITQVLSESAYRDLIENAVTAALRATPAAASSMRRGNNFRGARDGQSNTQNTQSEAQTDQSNARALLIRLQALLPQIDQYLPARSQAVRQKLSESGMGNDPRFNFGQVSGLMQQNTSESLLAAAAAAPMAMQPRLYQQSGLKAVDEGDTDRALQIANDHLDTRLRDAVLQSVNFKQVTLKAKAEKIEEVRQALSRLPSDQERVRLLLQLASATQKDNAKLALQFLHDARHLVTRRAVNYQQFEDQLQVAHAFAALDPAHSFEMLEMGINQLNELLPAAAMLSGFDVNIFKDGELPLQGGSMLANMVMRYGQELVVLSKSDFERALITADKFQLPESRLLARLSIVQGVLGKQPIQPIERFGGRGFGPAGPFIRRQP